MKKFIYFYDQNEVLIDRYPAKISNFITEKYAYNNFIFIFSEKYFDDKPKNIPENCHYFFIEDLNVNRIIKLFEEFPPCVLVTIAQRIPDMLILSIFNKKKIPTYIVQHGLWSDKLERIPIFNLLISKFKKFIYYTRYARSICKINKLPFLPFLVDLYQFLLVEEIKVPETRYLKTPGVRANKVFLYDESWDDYYINKYGYNKNDLIYIGNPDFQLLKHINLGKQEDAVCYLCQSLVEDGRYKLKDYESFLSILNNYVANNKKLYIKLHPRSREEYYKVFKNNTNVILTSDLPVCKYYIAHYTGLLATAQQCSENILIWNLKNHHMPPYFYRFATVITDKTEELNKFINEDFRNNNPEEYIKFNKEEILKFNPIETIAENLIQMVP